MKNIYLILILLSIAVGVNADYTSKPITGDYDHASSWVGDIVPSATEQIIIISEESVITKNGTFSWGNGLVINGTFNVIGGFSHSWGAVTVNGTLDVSGDFNGHLTIGDGAIVRVNSFSGGSFDVKNNGSLIIENNCSLTAASYIKNGGRVEIFGDLNMNSNIEIDHGGTLIVHGNFNAVGNWGMNISGNLIVKGDFSTKEGTIHNTGNVVIGGNFYRPDDGGFKGTNSENFYIIDPNATVEAPEWSSVGKGGYGNEDDLYKNEADNEALLNELGNLGLLKTGWTGDVSSVWNDKDNWASKLVPLPLMNVTIDVATGKHNPEISGVASMGNLTITKGTVTIKPGAKATILGDINVNGGSLIIEHNTGGGEPASVVHTGSSTGNVTVKVTFPSLKRNWYIGHPVVSNRDDYGTDFDVWSFNHSNGAWPVVSAGTSMAKPTDGYVVINKSGVETSVTHTGALATGNQKVNLTTSSPNGFNLIANPYNGYLNPKLLDFTGMRPTIWYRTVVDNNYVFTTYNVVAGVPLPYDNDELIAPMQAFWVRTDVDNKELTFSNSLLSLVHPLPLTGDNPKFKSSKLPVNDVLYIQLSNSISIDQTAIAFRANGSTELSRIDSDKRLNASKVPDIYTIKSNKQVAISIMPELEENTSVKMGFSLLKDANKELYIEAVDINNFMPGTEVWLVDNHTGIRTNLRTSGYSFNADAGTDNSRFTIEIGRVATGIEDNDTVENSNAIQVYAANGNAIVKVDDPKSDVVVNIYNLAGQLVNSTKEASSRIEVALPASRNVYVVEVQTDDTVFKKKIVH